jgi:hypothetical protein
MTCDTCDAPMEFIRGKAFTGWVHAETGRIECASLPHLFGRQVFDTRNEL